MYCSGFTIVFGCFDVVTDCYEVVFTFGRFVCQALVCLVPSVHHSPHLFSHFLLPRSSQLANMDSEWVPLSQVHEVLTDALANRCCSHSLTGEAPSERRGSIAQKLYALCKAMHEAETRATLQAALHPYTAFTIPWFWCFVASRI